MKRFLNRHTYAVLFTILLLSFFSILANRILGGEVLLVDEFMKGRLQSLQTEESLRIFTLITEMGSAPGIIGTLIISSLLLWRKKQYISLVLFPITVLVTHIVNKWLKSLVERERPTLNELVDGVGYSFPSGHAMLSMVTYGFVIFLIERGKFGKATRAFTVIGAVLLIAAVGLSRVVLSVHYPSDVLGGYCIGGMLLILSFYAHHFLSNRKI